MRTWRRESRTQADGTVTNDYRKHREGHAQHDSMTASRDPTTGSQPRKGHKERAAAAAATSTNPAAHATAVPLPHRQQPPTEHEHTPSHKLSDKCVQYIYKTMWKGVVKKTVVQCNPSSLGTIMPMTAPSRATTVPTHTHEQHQPVPYQSSKQVKRYRTFLLRARISESLSSMAMRRPLMAMAFCTKIDSFVSTRSCRASVCLRIWAMFLGMAAGRAAGASSRNTDTSKKTHTKKKMRKQCKRWCVKWGCCHGGGFLAINRL